MMNYILLKINLMRKSIELFNGLLQKTSKGELV